MIARLAFKAHQAGGGRHRQGQDEHRGQQPPSCARRDGCGSVPEAAGPEATVSASVRPGPVRAARRARAAAAAVSLESR